MRARSPSISRYLPLSPSISAVSRLYLRCISPVSPLHLPRCEHKDIKRIANWIEGHLLGTFVKTATLTLTLALALALTLALTLTRTLTLAPSLTLALNPTLTLTR